MDTRNDARLKGLRRTFVNEKGLGMEDRMIELEMKMAHFEQTIDELSEVIAHQQTDIDRLRAHIDALLKHIREGTADSGDNLA